MEHKFNCLIITISKDCRPEEEYVVSHIPGAVRVDYENDAEKILEKLPSKGNYYTKGKGLDPIIRFNAATFFCLSKAKTWIYNIMCCGFFVFNELK
jgi:rhodanese-related sulfurtransferase